MPIPKEYDNASENFGLYKDEKSILEKWDIEKDNRVMVGKSLDIESHARDGLLKHIL